MRLSSSVSSGKPTCLQYDNLVHVGALSRVVNLSQAAGGEYRGETRCIKWYAVAHGIIITYVTSRPKMLSFSSGVVLVCRLLKSGTGGEANCTAHAVATIQRRESNPDRSSGFQDLTTGYQATRAVGMAGI